MPGRISSSQGAVYSVPSLMMCTLGCEHSVTRLAAMENRLVAAGCIAFFRSP